MNDKIARFAVGSISPYFVSTSFKIQVQNIKAQASGVLELFYFSANHIKFTYNNSSLIKD